ncbi:MAG: hypothetical protein LUD69_09165, partial [Oscillospiraceae bacterium]|nr:hypothetical protein [Oscillospiraceae bacterium]
LAEKFRQPPQTHLISASLGNTAQSGKSELRVKFPSEQGAKVQDQERRKARAYPLRVILFAAVSRPA